MSKLNPQQKEAVLHTEGPVLILAGAGSGKTNTMTHRIAHLIGEKKVSPRSILGLSFTNKAANELKERVKKLVSKMVPGRNPTEGITISTFHSLCVKILREFAPMLGYTSQFSILTPSDQEDIVKDILKNIKIDEKKFDPSWILFQMSQAKNQFLTGDQAIEFFDGLQGPKVAYDDYSIALQSVYPRYLERAKLLNSMDFDDLLYNAVRLLEEHPEIRKTLSKRFQYIMVDEYQDTNAAQFRLLKALTSEHSNICVVGDDDQSIYAWRGADPTHILNFEKYYPGTKKIVLSQNYRSTEVILKAANQVIAKNKKRFPKELWSNRGTGSPIHMVTLEDDQAEATFVAQTILEQAKLQHSEQKWKLFAILYRSNSQSRIFEEALRQHQIPYKLVGAMSFLDRREVKDVLSYWKLILNPKDDAALRRVINWPARGIGKTSLEKIYTYALQNSLPVMEVIQNKETLSTLELPPAALKGCETFTALIQQLQGQLSATNNIQEVSLFAKRTLEVLKLREELEDRFENVEELASSIGFLDASHFQSGPQVFQEFVSNLTLSKPEDEKSDDDKNAVTLMTLHGAKGLEFPVVFLVGLEDGYLPHQRTIDGAEDLAEERRLFYVGITRAQDELYISRAKHRIRYGKAVPRNPSRFLDDLPEDLLLEKDESANPAFKNNAAKEKHEEMVLDFFKEFQDRLKKK